MKIVVADDDREIRMSLAGFLEDSGHSVLQAADGQKALELVTAHSPDLVLLDLRMPRVDGHRALRRLAKEQPDLPVIVISGTGQIADAVEALRIGAWDYLTKPIADMSALTIAIDKAVEKQLLRAQVREYQNHLEELVEKRTAELQAANRALEEKAIALREVVNLVQEDKLDAQRSMADHIETTVLPLLQRAREQAPLATRAKIEQAEKNLQEVTSPFMNHLTRRFASLTPSEVRICQLLRRGMSSKEIAQVENISPDTVDTHRRHIRRKLNISSEQVNLVTFLQSLDTVGGTLGGDPAPR